MDRDNHAGKLDSISYIAGFFDGEGYIGLGKQRKASNGGTNILPSIRMSNTDPRPLEFIHGELNKMGINAWYSFGRGKSGERRFIRADGTRAKRIGDVGLSGQCQVKKFIQALRPYVMYKGEQMDVMMEFITSREKKMEGRGGRKGKGKAEYDAYEISLVDKLRALKHQNFIESKSPETTRLDP